MPSLTVPRLLDQVKTSALSALIPHSLDFYKSCVRKDVTSLPRGLDPQKPRNHTPWSREDGVGREDGRKTEGRKEEGQCRCALSGGQASVGTQSNKSRPRTILAREGCILTAGCLLPDLHSTSRGEGSSGGKDVIVLAAL